MIISLPHTVQLVTKWPLSQWLVFKIRDVPAEPGVQAHEVLVAMGAIS